MHESNDHSAIEQLPTDCPSTRYAHVPELVLHAVRDGTITPGDLVVFAALALHADGNGRRCFPGHRGIVKHTGFKPRSVTAAIQRLIRTGVIKRLKNGGRGRGNSEYQLIVRGTKPFTLGSSAVPHLDGNRAQSDCKIGRSPTVDRAQSDCKTGRSSEVLQQPPKTTPITPPPPPPPSDWAAVEAGFLEIGLSCTTKALASARSTETPPEDVLTAIEVAKEYSADQLSKRPATGSESEECRPLNSAGAAILYWLRNKSWPAEGIPTIYQFRNGDRPRLKRKQREKKRLDWGPSKQETIMQESAKDRPSQETASDGLQRVANYCRQMFHDRGAFSTAGWLDDRKVIGHYLGTEDISKDELKRRVSEYLATASQ